MLIDDSELVVSVTAMRPFIAETAAQLSWLCAACRAGPHENQIANSTPQITFLERSDPTFQISALVSPIQHYEVQRTLNGYCWRDLFRNPVLVTGVPIAARDYAEKGLEMPLNMMAALGQTPYAAVFDDRVVIKGHSTMFVPTERSQTSAVWHFMYNEDGSRIPYWAATSDPQHRINTDALNFRDLQETRHFLGWTNYACSKAGKRTVDRYRVFNVRSDC